jgi:hypothetical protein
MENVAEAGEKSFEWTISAAVTTAIPPKRHAYLRARGRLLQPSKRPRNLPRMLAARGVIGVSHRVRQVDQRRSSAARGTDNSSGSQRVTDDEGDRGGPTLGRLPEGVSRERARCVRGIPAIRDGEGKLVDLGGSAISKS